MSETEAVVTIYLIDVITVRVYDAYIAGRNDYVKKNPGGSVLMADYAGALALIKAQFAKVTGPDEFTKYLKDPIDPDTPLSIVGTITREIAYKVEQAVNSPLAWTVTAS